MSNLPPPLSIFSFCASIAATWIVIRPMVHGMMPQPILHHIISFFRSRLQSRSTSLTLVIEDPIESTPNAIYDAAEIYLSTKLSPDAANLRISRSPKSNHIDLYLSNGETVTDFYRGVKLIWRYVSKEPDKSTGQGSRCYFELTFHRKHKELIFNSYVPYLLSMAKEIENRRRMLKIYTLNTDGFRWESGHLEHSVTFNTMAMETELKNAVIEDLDRFIRRRDFYERVGKSLKRRYFLYGPPGAGKFSLVAGMADYLRFDVYNLQLANIKRDSDFRSLLLAIRNRSILVIKDLDSAVDLPNWLQAVESYNQVDKQVQLTLSGLLNLIDRLWSSCGDERIIIVTANRKEKPDPALLRPGWIDKHIYMGYCTFQGFKTLASSYLGLPCSSSQRLYGEIESIIDGTEVTPAQVAEELMKSEDADVALEGLVKVLHRKRLEGQTVSSREEMA